MNPRNRLNTQVFIERSKKVHGLKYDYSLVEYKDNRTKVKIICPVHGIFEQIPMAHLRGSGCLKCTRTTLENFIEKARIKHGNKYDYSLVDYKHSKQKVDIICPVHGVFKQIPNAHLTSKNGGCPECARDLVKEKRRFTKSQFIERAKLIHGDKYDYSLVEYVNKETKVKIICPDHGIFEQRPGAHILKNGCPKCSLKSFSRGEKELLKYIKSIYSGEILENNRDIIFPYELDIFLPELKIAIEYNGIYWHKIKERLNPGIHKLKASLCKERGIKLVNIAEKTWLTNKLMVRERLKSLITF